MPSQFHHLITLPHSCSDKTTWTALLDKYKSFRLLSLKLSAGHFAAKHDDEVVFKRIEWEKRLSNPLTNTVVLVDHHDGAVPVLTDDESLASYAIAADWLGWIVVHGPTEQFDFVYPVPPMPAFEVNEQPTPGRVPYYYISGLWVHPSARGRGLGKVLMNAVIERGEAFAKANGLSEVKFVLGGDKDNEVAMKVYRRFGFTIVKENVYEKAPGRLGTAVWMVKHVGLRSHNQASICLLTTTPTPYV